MDFQDYEEIGRRYFKTFLKENYPNYKIEFTPGKYDDYDALMTGYTSTNKEVEMLVEIKKREYTTDFTNKWLLETDKVERCISIADSMNRKPVFVNITGDDIRWNGQGIDVDYGNVQIWNMHDCEDYEMTVNSPKTTCGDTTRRDKEYKVFDVKNAKVNKPRKSNEKKK